MSDNIVVWNAQPWLHMDNTPFREIRQLLPDLKHTVEDVQRVAFKAEVVAVPSGDDSEWVEHQATGKQWWTLTFVDGTKTTFERDDQGVRVGRDPDEVVLEIEANDQKS
jgi:hypothetical protein